MGGPASARLVRVARITALTYIIERLLRQGTKEALTLVSFTLISKILLLTERLLHTLYCNIQFFSNYLLDLGKKLSILYNDR